jgi:hypothetical protein
VVDPIAKYTFTLSVKFVSSWKSLPSIDSVKKVLLLMSDDLCKKLEWDGQNFLIRIAEIQVAGTVLADKTEKQVFKKARFEHIFVKINVKTQDWYQLLNLLRLPYIGLGIFFFRLSFPFNSTYSIGTILFWGLYATFKMWLMQTWVQSLKFILKDTPLNED